MACELQFSTLIWYFGHHHLQFLRPDVTILGQRGRSYGGVPLSRFSTTVGLCCQSTQKHSLPFIHFALIRTIIHWMNIMQYWGRLETSDWDHKVIRKKFTVINQIRSKVILDFYTIRPILKCCRRTWVSATHLCSRQSWKYLKSKQKHSLITMLNDIKDILRWMNNKYDKK